MQIVIYKIEENKNLSEMACKLDLLNMQVTHVCHYRHIHICELYILYSNLVCIV